MNSGIDRGLGRKFLPVAFCLLPFALCLLPFPCGGQGGGDFEFVVIGDTRPRFESENFGIFEGLIEKINAARPALVVNLGDLIYGYGLLSKESQWDKYQAVVRRFRVPYYQVPGNHDTYSRQARRIYGRRFGHFYESFDYQDAHFVLLDNNDEGRWGRIGAAQLDWLRNDLRQTSAQSVFVFLHFPVWEPERVAPQMHEFWSTTLHPLFRASRVRAVFGGHFHCYGPTRELDGIQYFISGGGGAELWPDYRRAGGEHHFLKVRVSGNKLDVRVVTPRVELSDADADLMGGLLFADRHVSRIGIAHGIQDLRRGLPFSLALSNPYPAVLHGSARWNLDTNVWSAQPPTLPVEIAPGTVQTANFTLFTRQNAAALSSLPWLEFDLSAGRRHHRFHREVLLLHEWKADFRPSVTTLEETAETWRALPAFSLAGSASVPSQLQAFHNGQVLFLSVALPTPAADEGEDSIGRDALQLGLARRLTPTEFSADVWRLGLRTARATVEVLDRTPGHSLGAGLPAVKATSQTEGATTRYRLAIPARLLRPLKIAEQHRLVLNLSFRAAEGPESIEPHPNAFSYLVRYGTEGLVPVHFLELTFAPPFRP